MSRLLNKLPSPWRGIVETVLTLAVAAVIAWTAQAYVVKPYTVPSASMEPTLEPGDYVLADRISLDFTNPSRYQIVVFHPPHCTPGHDGEKDVCNTTSLKYRDGAAGTTFIKRVIGLPGDTVYPQNGHLWVKPAGGKAFQLHEPYVANGNELAGLPLHRMTIPKGYYLMLGDNRLLSDDSRGWGLEPRGDIIGVARVRYWPLGRLGGL
ncbi:MAG: signal peptidase I [Gaiellales bacterium]